MSFCTVVPSTATVGAARARRAGPLLTATAASRPGTSTSLGLSTSGALLRLRHWRERGGCDGEAVSGAAIEQRLEREVDRLHGSVHAEDQPASLRDSRPHGRRRRRLGTLALVGIVGPGRDGRRRIVLRILEERLLRDVLWWKVDDDEGGLRRSHPHELGGRRSGGYPEVHELEGEGEEVVASEGGRAQVRHLLWPGGYGADDTRGLSRQDGGPSAARRGL